MKSLDDLPNDVLTVILQNISRSIIRKNIATPSLAIKTLLRLESTSKGLYKIINDDIWKSAWETFLETNEYLKKIDGKNPKKCLLLYSLIGCQFCQKARIRKIYEEFQVRCCKDCLYNKTISDYNLKTNYLVDKSKVNNLPSITTDMWNRKIGSYTLIFYWIDDVEEHIGLPLDEYYRSEKERRDLLEEELNNARIIRENIHKQETISTMYEMLLNDPKYACIDKNHIESYVDSNSRMNAIDILNNLLKSYNVKQFDKILLKQTRSQKVSIIDVRKTSLYKQRISGGIFCDFTED